MALEWLVSRSIVVLRKDDQDHPPVLERLHVFLEGGDRLIFRTGARIGYAETR
jgi:hypothetical protein